MRRGTIAVVGENLIDIFVDVSGALTPVPGGGPFNVARTISRLGQKAVLFSAISTDGFGRTLQSVLDADGVQLALPGPLDYPTSLAIIEMGSTGPHYGFHLNGTAAFQLDEPGAIAAYNSLGDDAAALYIGTLGLLVEPMASTSESLVNMASPNTLVVLDPNCRPSAITNHDDYRRRLIRLFSRSDIVKVSTEDLAYLSPDTSSAQAAGAMTDRGVKWVVVTDGPGEVRLLGANSSFSIDVPVVKVVDSVGAGDAFVGGFLAWWIGHGLGRSELADSGLVRCAISAAIAIASNTCTRQGAQPPWAEEMRQTPGWGWL
jgi:fructokinase